MKELVLELKPQSLWRAWLTDLSELTKLRLTFLVILSTLAGFYMGSGPVIDWWLLLHALIGTACVAAGAAVLNEVLEVDADRRMRRTQHRPIPAGRISAVSACCLGLTLAAGGLLYLLSTTNTLACTLAAITLVCYLLVYTPLKKLTSINTLVGAIPGALPPVIGYAAAQHNLGPAALALFLILFFWQMPHFLAIAWIYRDDYASAGFKMLTLRDRMGYRTAAKSAAYALLLLLCSLAPFWLDMSNGWYLLSAGVCGVGYLIAALAFVRHPDISSARRLFLASILYLPVVLFFLALHKLS